MPAPPPPGMLYRFGVFEANPATGELWKRGTRLKIQEQPFQVLWCGSRTPRSYLVAS